MLRKDDGLTSSVTEEGRTSDWLTSNGWQKDARVALTWRVTATGSTEGRTGEATVTVQQLHRERVYIPNNRDDGSRPLP